MSLILGEHGRFWEIIGDFLSSDLQKLDLSIIVPPSEKGELGFCLSSHRMSFVLPLGH
jgi:hypothetical protein